MSDFRTTNFGIIFWNAKWRFHLIFCTCSKAHFFLFVTIHFHTDLPAFVVVFEGESKCTSPPKFVPICFVNSNSIVRECPEKKILPTYAGRNAPVEAITRRHVQYLKGDLEVHYFTISGAIGETSIMEKLSK
ncbi:hypothetical protein Y032_0014g2335 [Ancylostoma ceylanicum]|uniref:Uncharacterized protein n=1 Tax=Ancylostoma ceylanicum TaxID=53326 RepID=A0A016VAU1_9BILA|nr:hypothetical protein Y032_0014g2335 [Ancylostoma ceylanicum]